MGYTHRVSPAAIVPPSAPSPTPGPSPDEALRAPPEDVPRLLAFLSHFTVALLEGAPGHRAMLGRLAKLAVPHLGDWCLVDLVCGGHVERIAAEHSNPDLRAFARTLPRTFPLAPGATTGISGAVASGRPELVETVPPRAPGEPGDVVALRTLHPRSYVILPLQARGRTRAVVTLALAESPGRYGAPDLALAQEVAARAAMALENALLSEEVERAARLHEDTMSSVAHDLKNPIAATLLGVQRLARLVEGPRKAQAGHMLDRLERYLRGMSRLLDEHLDLARSEAGRLPIDRRPEAPASVVARAVAPLEPLAAERGQRIEVVVQGDPPPPSWDPDRIVQALANLVEDALKSSPDGAAIRVRAEQTPDGLRVAVQGEGPGLAPEVVARLFDRASHPAGTLERGRGLGLLVAKGIVEAHGGRAWVEAAPGRGATYLFTIPVAPPA